MQNNTLKTNTQTKTTFPNAHFAFLFGTFVIGPLFYLFISILIGLPTLLLLTSLNATITYLFVTNILAAITSPITMGVCSMLGGLGMLYQHHHELKINKPLPQEQSQVSAPTSNNEAQPSSSFTTPTHTNMLTGKKTQDASTQTDDLVVTGTEVTP